jgi:hypothetical protein
VRRCPYDSPRWAHHTSFRGSGTRRALHGLYLDYWDCTARLNEKRQREEGSRFQQIGLRIHRRGYLVQLPVRLIPGLAHAERVPSNSPGLGAWLLGTAAVPGVHRPPMRDLCLDDLSDRQSAITGQMPLLFSLPVSSLSNIILGQVLTWGTFCAVHSGDAEAQGRSMSLPLEG